MMPTATAEHPKDSVLDALAVLICLNRNAVADADAMLNSYAATGELSEFVSAIAALALCSVRYAALAAGKSAEDLLAGVAQQIREQA